MTHWRRKTRRQTNAFSMIEMLVVLTVMSVMIALATPAINSLNNPRRVAIQDLKALLENARALALKERTDIYVAFTDNTPGRNDNQYRRYALFRPDSTDPHPDPLFRRVVLVDRWRTLERGVIFALGQDFEIPSGVPFGTVLEAPTRRVFPSNLESENGGWSLPFLMFDPEGRLRFPAVGEAAFHNVGIIEGTAEGGMRSIQKMRKGKELIGLFPESECLHLELYSGRPRIFTD